MDAQNDQMDIEVAKVSDHCGAPKELRLLWLGVPSSTRAVPQSDQADIAGDW